MSLWLIALLALLLTCSTALRRHLQKRQRSKARRDERIKKRKRRNPVPAGLFRMRKRLAEIGRTQTPYPPMANTTTTPEADRLDDSRT